MKYKIYLSQAIAIDKLSDDAELIAEVETPAEVMDIVTATAKDFRKDNPPPYYRYLMGDKITFIDYGSWSKYIAVEPALRAEELFSNRSNY